jgi:rSAM/selenodomain-associated transferase 1
MKIMSAEPVHVAVFAKAPVAGTAKTRLIPALGARGAARLQRTLTRRALRTAVDARLGPVTLWCAPDARHRFFRALQRAAGVDCRAQPDGDLGQRMHAAFRWHCARGPVLLIGTDCPALTVAVLHAAARALRGGDDAVFLPAEDGGYVLIGLRRPRPALFEGVPWGTAGVMEQTRARLRAAGITWSEPAILWDVDVPADLARLHALGRDEVRQRNGLTAAAAGAGPDDRGDAGDLGDARSRGDGAQSGQAGPLGMARERAPARRFPETAR